MITRLAGALLEELLYQDGRTTARLRELGESVSAARGLLGTVRLEQERARLREARGGLLWWMEERERQLAEREQERLRALAQRLEEEEEEPRPRTPRPRTPRPRTPRPRTPELPLLAGLEERLLYLRGWEIVEGLQPHHVADLLGEGVKITTLAGWARRYGVPPRWLAFGEDAPGDDPAGLGARLRQAREAAQLTRRGLGEGAGVSNSLISMIENGYRGSGGRGTVTKGGSGELLTTSLGTVLRLAAVLDVPPGWLAYGDADAE